MKKVSTLMLLVMGVMLLQNIIMPVTLFADDTTEANPAPTVVAPDQDAPAQDDEVVLDDESAAPEDDEMTEEEGVVQE
ncbi:hypothetical protein JW979_05730 [bacterium]|nr:hypothetical protein [candidate division CSSED10-310 bacterium]